MLPATKLKEIADRHQAVAAGDMRFTDKVAHRDRGLLLDHIAALSRKVGGGNGPTFNPSCSCAMCRSYFNSTPNQ